MVIEESPTFAEGIQVMFGVAFDLDIHELEDVLNVPRQKAYADIESALVEIGYKHVQYSVYVCSEPRHSEMLVVHETVEALKGLPWFSDCMKQVVVFEVARWGDISSAFKN